MSLMMITCALFGRISMGQHQDYAGRSLRSTRIHRLDLSLADRGLHDKAIGRHWPLLHLERVASAACDLQPPIDAIERLADDAPRVDIERVRFYRSVHFHWDRLLKSDTLQPAPRVACGARGGS